MASTTPRTLSICLAQINPTVGDVQGNAAKALEAKDEDSGKYYVKVMQKASEKGDFVTKETERLQKMIEDGAVKADKKKDFGRRLNILSSFA